MLLTNGRIYLMDAWDTVVDTLVVRDGRVAFAGRRSEVNVAGAEEIVDLGGRAVVPGLVDAHGHLMHLARGRLTLDAGGARSEAEVAERVAARAARTPRGEWLGGRGWDQNRWPDRQWPTRASLDRAAGLTGIHEMGAELSAIASYRRLVERGQFPFRNYVAVAARSESTWSLYREHGPETIGDGRVVVGALKLMADGALGSRGAALH